MNNRIIIIFLVFNVIVGTLILIYPLPTTISSIARPNRSVTENQYIPMCNGIQCLFCGYECFLPEGQIGLCKIRVNSGNKKYLLKD